MQAYWRKTRVKEVPAPEQLDAVSQLPGRAGCAQPALQAGLASSSASKQSLACMSSL